MIYKLKLKGDLIDIDAQELPEAMKEADEKINFTEDDAYLTDHAGRNLYIRRWYNMTLGMDKFSDPIKFGGFGFYGDWVQCR